VTIGKNVWLGNGVLVLPGAEIGDHAVVAAKSVVRNSLPAGVLAAGNPATVVKQLDIPEGWTRGGRGDHLCHRSRRLLARRGGIVRAGGRRSAAAAESPEPSASWAVSSLVVAKYSYMSNITIYVQSTKRLRTRV
jgi:hypothetical protein